MNGSRSCCNNQLILLSQSVEYLAIGDQALCFLPLEFFFDISIDGVVEEGGADVGWEELELPARKIRVQHEYDSHRGRPCLARRSLST